MGFAIEVYALFTIGRKTNPWHSSGKPSASTAGQTSEVVNAVEVQKKVRSIDIPDGSRKSHRPAQRFDDTRGGYVRGKQRGPALIVVEKRR